MTTVKIVLKCKLHIRKYKYHKKVQNLKKYYTQYTSTQKNTINLLKKTRNNPETSIITGSGIASTLTVLLVALLEEASTPPSRVFSIRVFLLLEKIAHHLSNY